MGDVVGEREGTGEDGDLNGTSAVVGFDEGRLDGRAEVVGDGVTNTDGGRVNTDGIGVGTEYDGPDVGRDDRG